MSSPSIAAAEASAPPGPRGLPFFGVMFEAQRDPVGLFERVVQTYGRTSLMRFGPHHMVLINRPEDIRHVFVENHENYRKSASYEAIGLALGHGLINSEVPLWRRQRKLVQPSFARERLVKGIDLMREQALAMAERWAGRREVDASEEMFELALDVVARSLLGSDYDDEIAALTHEVLTRMMAYCRGAETVMLIPTWAPTPTRIRAVRANRRLDRKLYQLIARRRQAAARPDDLLTRMMEATDEAGEAMTDLQLRDELVTLLIAGHETTANALTWAWHLLARNPEAADRIAAEAASALPSGRVTPDDLARLVYTEAVAKESMRLFPPVWIFDREAQGDDVVGGFHVKKGWIVAACPWTLHHDPDLHPEPNAFRPERFLPENAARLNKFGYIPFGVGPRTCIGNAYAIQEIKIVLATLAGRYRLLREGPPPAMEPSITLRVKGKGALTMRIEPRARPA